MPGVRGARGSSRFQNRRPHPLLGYVLDDAGTGAARDGVGGAGPFGLRRDSAKGGRRRQGHRHGTCREAPQDRADPFLVRLPLLLSAQSTTRFSFHPRGR